VTLFLDQKKEVNFQSFFSLTRLRHTNAIFVFRRCCYSDCLAPAVLREIMGACENENSLALRDRVRKKTKLSHSLSLSISHALSLSRTHTHTGATESQSTKKTQLLYLNSQKKGVWPTFPGRNKKARNEWQFLLHLARQIICNEWINIYKCSHKNSQWFWGGHH